MNNSLDDVLQRYFDDVARHDGLGDTPVRVVMRRGRRRKARRRTGAMAGTLMVGALGSVVAVRTLSGGEDQRRSVSVGNDASEDGGDGPSPVPTTGRVQLQSSPLVWNEMTIGSAEAIAAGPQQVIADPAGGGYYALSTEPGRANGESVSTQMYHSTDGIRWESRGGQPPISSRSDLSAAAGKLYAVGTVAASAPVAQDLDPGNLVLAQSEDGGLSWNEQPLPLDLGGVRTLPKVKGMTVNAAIAAGESGAVVAAVTRATLDYDALTPAGVSPNSLDWWSDPDGLVQFEETVVPCSSLESTASTEPPPDASTPTLEASDSAETTTSTSPTQVTETTVQYMPLGDGGCSVRGPEVRRYSWDELGVPPETVRAQRGTLHLLFAADGTTFTEQAVPPTPDGWVIGSVRALATGSQYTVIFDLQRPASSGNVESQVMAYTSRDGITWSTSELPDGASVSTVGALADGTVVAAGYGAEPVAVLRDGAWRAAALADLDLGEDVILSSTTEPAIGPLGVAILATIGRPTGALPPVADTAAVPTTVTGLVAMDGRAIDPASTRQVLLFSPDGLSWSMTDLTSMGSGDGAFLAGATVTDRNVMLRYISPSNGDPNEPLPDQRLFVGTLAG